jgi:hypothetical protein
MILLLLRCHLTTAGVLMRCTRTTGLLDASKVYLVEGLSNNGRCQASEITQPTTPMCWWSLLDLIFTGLCQVVATTTSLLRTSDFGPVGCILSFCRRPDLTVLLHHLLYPQRSPHMVLLEVPNDTFHADLLWCRIAR